MAFTDNSQKSDRLNLRIDFDILTFGAIYCDLSKDRDIKFVSITGTGYPDLKQGLLLANNGKATSRPGVVN